MKIITNVNQIKGKTFYMFAMHVDDALAHNAPDDDKYFIEWDDKGNGQLFVACGESEWMKPIGKDEE